nr:retrovirus-related Pol polyprotein from transposon TNT 1-94 [Tanacetum cinerariifolium]
MHKAFPLLEESSHWQYNFLLPVEGVPTARGMEIPLPRVCTAMIKKLPDSSVALTDFTDADHTRCQDTRRSTSGSVQFLGGRLIGWSSKRKKSAAISSTEVEYIALSGCCAQIFWIYHFIKEQVKNGVIELYFVNTEYQLADLFTKALGRDRIEFLTNKLGMRSFTLETLKQLMNEEEE